MAFDEDLDAVVAKPDRDAGSDDETSPALRLSWFSKAMEDEQASWPADTYGFLTFSVMKVYASADYLEREKEIFSLCFAVLLYTMVLGMQLFITAFLMMSATQMERTMQDSYFQKHYGTSVSAASAKLSHAAVKQFAISDKVLSEMHCMDGAGDHFLCRCHEQIKVELPLFYHIMISIWTIRMLSELKTAFWYVVHVFGVREPADGIIRVKRKADDLCQILKIDRLSMKLKIVLVVLDPLTRLIVASILTYAGAKFLLVQTNQAKLVLKVLTMQFVVQVDDFLFGSLVTKKAQIEVKSAKLCTVFGSPKRSTWWENGVGSSVYLLASLFFVYVVEYGIFHELTTFRNSCREFRDAMQFSEFGLGRPQSISQIVHEILTN